MGAEDCSQLTMCSFSENLRFFQQFQPTLESDFPMAKVVLCSWASFLFFLESQ